MFNRSNNSRADIPCILENDIGETAGSMQPATLYITINITPPNLYRSLASIPTEGGGSLAHEAPIPGPTQPPSPERHLPIEAGNNKPQSREEVSPATTRNLSLDFRRVDEATERINRSNTCQGVVRRIKWVMDTLGPIVEVRVIPF